MPLAPKSRLGVYEILGPLGAGGMGEVYRAKDLRLGREVAVKVLPEAVSSSPDRLARFEREARTVAGLNHPNIVVLHSIEEEHGIRFLTMELVDGQPLSKLIAPGGLPLAQILEVAIRIADALNAAHERGVIHRDLKPGNVMMSREGWVKVLDFGLAKVAVAQVAANQDPPAIESMEARLNSLLPDDVTVDAPISLQGQVMGTVPYMAPEQVRGEPTDARSDLFALGIILYELATGSRPFHGTGKPGIASSILEDTPQPLRGIRSDLPLGLEQLVSRCLEKNPRERIRSALEVSNELRSIRRAMERVDEPGIEKVASIAVLPFANRGASAEDDYFSDGLADELLNVLAKVEGLRVSARSSSFRFKGGQATVAEVGQALNVATVLEGSVRKAGNRMRISVQLVNVADSSNLWSETYDRTLDDIFAVQDDIAQSVVKELRSALLGEEPDSDASVYAKAEVAKAARGRAADPEAQRLFLQARHLIDRWTREDVAKGIEYLKEALELDPQFAMAWAELAGAFAREAGRGWVPAPAGYGRAREAVKRAISLEPDLAEGHSTLGWIRMTHDWDWSGADECYRRALALAPGSATVLGFAGALASILGRHQEAIALFRRSIERNPLSVAGYNNLGQELKAGGQFEEAEGAYRKALDLAPQSAGARGGLALTLLAQGRIEEALAEAAREPEGAYRLWAQATIYNATGHVPESSAALRDLIEIGAQDNAFQIAEVHAFRGEADAAFEWLERAYLQRDTGLAETKNTPHLRSLHGDPRWGAFLRKMGFEA
jgi:serine/threonine protein kinase/Tfp pilus assembly protein PilF